MLDFLSDFPCDVAFDFEKVLEKNERSEQGDTDKEEPQNPGDICKFYLKGSCMKGPACPYRHSRNDRAVVCKHWLRALCKKGDLCEFLHEYDMTKMPECYFFSKYGMLIICAQHDGLSFFNR